LWQGYEAASIAAGRISHEDLEAARAGTKPCGGVREEVTRVLRVAYGPNGVFALRLTSTAWILVRNGIETIDALRERIGDGSLRSLKGIGPKRFADLRKALADYDAGLED
jgi:hypothetical protein